MVKWKYFPGLIIAGLQVVEVIVIAPFVFIWCRCMGVGLPKHYAKRIKDFKKQGGN